jgi:hypothetical protein
MLRSMPRTLAGGLVLAALAWGPASAQPMYKCVTHSGVTYSGTPCPGAQQVGADTRRITDKSVPPPQDRATLARRATLSPEEKQECRTLDGLMRDQQARLKDLGERATLQDEMPLVHNKKRYREIGC